MITFFLSSLLRRGLFHFFGRHVSDVLSEVPLMTFGIDSAVAAITVEGVFKLLDDPGASLFRA